MTGQGSAPPAQVELDVPTLRSLAARLNGFAFRCRNDAQYSILYITSSIEHVVGFPAQEFLRSKARSLASVIVAEDLPINDWAVIEALAAKT